MRSASFLSFPRLFGVILLLLLAGYATLFAQEKAARPVISSYTLGVGSAHVADTYLTPLRYHGTAWRFDYRRLQAGPFAPERITSKADVSLSLEKTHNPAGNATMWDAMIGIDWGLMRRWRPLPSLALAVGGEIAVSGGAFYNTRNGNNPVSAKASATVGLTGLAVFDFRIGRLPARLIYQPSIPVAGAFFSPEYGQLYYEIYLGERKNLAHCAWWGNYFALDHLLALDLRFGARSLRLGYQGKIYSTHVNHILTRSFTHLFVIGFTTEWLAVNPRKHSSLRLINAF
ncbi:MAG: DUF3316 domain-containing protein [Duncaniella sp.]|nr:DUF3316 domain-containing protein [Duncaniella sp.]